MTPDEADDFISENGSGASRAEVWSRQQDEEEAAHRALSGPILADLARDTWAEAIGLAVRAQEMDLFTDSWEVSNPDEERREKIATRRQQAETYREEAAIMRRRARALEDGAQALGWKGEL